MNLVCLYFKMAFMLNMEASLSAWDLPLSYIQFLIVHIFKDACDME